MDICSVMLSSAVCRHCTELFRLEWVPHGLLDSRRCRAAHRPLPGLASGLGCEEPACASLCQTHEARSGCVLLNRA